MFQADEIVRVLTGAIMKILPEGGVVYVPKSETNGPPEDERFCVQIDSRSEEHYAVRVVEMTAAQRRHIAGRTESALRARLAADGWTIKVWHLRQTDGGPVPMMTKWQARRLGIAILAKGGRTEVEIVSPDGARYFYGKAVCSPDDAYCRAEGRAIALDRAMRLYEAAGFPTMAQLRDGGYPDGFGAAAGAQS